MSSLADETEARLLDAEPHEFRRGAAMWTNRVTKSLMRAGRSIYSSIPIETVHDGSRAASQGAPADDSEQGEQPDSAIDVAFDPFSYRELPATHKFVIDVDVVFDFDVEAYVSALFEAANSMREQIEAGIMQHISDMTTATGNVVSYKDRDFVDAFLDALESMTFSFDDDGNPNATIVLTPEKYEELKDKQFTPEQQARHDAIIARKREEWNASKRRRELPRLGE